MNLNFSLIEEHGHGAHPAETEDKAKISPEPFVLQLKPYAQVVVEFQAIPQPTLAGGVHAGVLFGALRNRHGFALGPTFQFTQGHRANFGIESRPRNFFSGLEFQLQRALPRNWAVATGASLGLRGLDARHTNLLLDQGIVLPGVKASAFEVQGYLQVEKLLRKSLGVFFRLHLGYPFYLTYQDSLYLGGLHGGMGFGIQGIFEWRARR